jgi:diguanylate cyclase (GGDEF)-like protein
VKHSAAIEERSLSPSRTSEERSIARAREGPPAARCDPLTGLPDRELFVERLHQAMAETVRRERLLGLLFLDLDRFKSINDTLGHLAGDRLLAHLAERLAGSVRSGDTPARFGGDEFVVLIGDLESPAGALAAARHVVSNLSEPVLLDGRTVRVGVSVGISLYPTHGRDMKELLRAADRAMYRAKDSGGGAVLYQAGMDDALDRRGHLGRDLQEALVREGLTLHFQPQVDAATGEIVGAEALLRWHHPRMGVLMPAAILALAAKIGETTALGAWVLRSACRQMQAWTDAGARTIPLAVNVSTEELLDADFPARVGGIVRGCGIDPRRLVLEIPGTGQHGASRTIGRALRSLKELGVQIALDDFGAGQTSLECLRSSPADLIKISRCFVHGMVSNPRDAAIVSALTTLARDIRIEAVAGGVESAAERDRLVTLSCRRMQGYFFGRPMSARRLGPLLSERGRQLPT